MPFTIPDTDGTVLGDIRAGIYAGTFDALVDGSRRYGVVSGCAVTANGSGLGVNVASGVIENDGVQVTVTPSSPAVTLNTADATLYRIDLIEVNSSGTVGKVSGTAAAAPVAPAGTSGSVRLAYVVVPPTLTTLVTATHVVDQRVSLFTPSSSLAGIYGDGADGNVTISGSTSLTRDMYYQDLAVTGTLDPNGWIVYVNGEISGNGTISRNGNNGTASGSGGGFGRTAARLGASSDGGNQGATNGAAASTVPNSFGAGGGKGGNGATGTGGAGGTVTTVEVNAGGVFASSDLLTMVRGYVVGPSSGVQRYLGGAGGGGGSGSTTAGGGGGGGAPVIVCARKCTFTGSIASKGGNGAAATGGNGGGGGGGGGGVVIVVTGASTQTFTVSAAGGTAGAGNGTGAAGVAGTTGTAKVWLGWT